MGRPRRTTKHTPQDAQVTDEPGIDTLAAEVLPFLRPITQAGLSLLGYFVPATRPYVTAAQLATAAEAGAPPTPDVLLHKLRTLRQEMRALEQAPRQHAKELRTARALLLVYVDLLLEQA